MTKYKPKLTIENSVTTISLITIILGIVKIVGIIHISWVWVLFPLWGSVMLLALLLLFLKKFE